MTLFEAVAKFTMDTSGFTSAVKSVQSGFSGINQMAGNAKSGISAFGDVLKTNLVSEAITKGLEAITNGFKSVTSMADNFIKSSVSAGMSFDSAMSQVYATMGDKAEEEIKYNGELMKSSEALRQFAKEMGATTKYSATESAEALNYMALAGYDAELSMKMLPNVMNLASAGAFDLARASDMITDTQTAMGLSVERTTKLVDEMAKAASTGNTSVEQLGDAFLTVGGLAKELNGGFVTLANGTKKPVDGVQELEIALTAMANAGVKGSEAGTHMRNLLMKLSAPTEDAKKLFDELGVTVFDSSGKMASLKDIFSELQTAFNGMNNQQKKLEAISEIFNARDTASATALLSAVEEGWDSIGESILQAEGAASKMSATQMDNLQGWKTIFNSAKEGLQISISEALEPTLRQIVKFGGESLQALTDTIQKDGIKNLGKAISGIMRKAGTLLMNNLPDFSRNVIKVLTAIKNGIADGIPVFLSYARAAIVRTLVLVQKELPEFLKAGKRITTELGKGLAKEFPYILRQVTSLANKAKEKIAENIPVILSGITELIQNIDFSKITSTLSTFIISAVNTASEIIDEIDWSVVGSAIGQALNGVDWYGIIESLINAVETVVKNAPELFNGIANTISFETANAMVTIGGGVIVAKAIIKGLGAKLTTLLAGSAGTALSGFFAGIPEVAIAALGGWTVGSLIRDAIGGEKIDEFLEPWLEVWYAGLEPTFEALEQGQKNLKDSLHTLSEEWKENFDNWKTGWKEVKDGLAEFWDSWKVGEKWLEDFGSEFYDSVEKAKTWGSDMIDNFISGIEERWDKAVKKISDFGEMIASYIGFSEPEKGALSRFHTFAPDMMQLFADGMEQNSSTVLQQAKTITDELASTFQNPFSVETSGTNSISNSGYSSGSAFSTPVVVQNLTITMPEWNISSPSDMRELANALTDQLVINLNARAIYDNRSGGGIGWQMN